MKSDTVSNWFQISASVAVIAGLGLVIWELQQTRQLVRAQLRAGAMEAWMQRELALLGEDPGPVLVKSCLQPDEVTSEEMQVLMSYFQLLMANLQRTIELEEVGGFEEEQWRKSAPGLLGNALFTSEHGRWFWENVVRRDPRPGAYRELIRFGDELLSRSGPPACGAFIEAFQRREPWPVGPQVEVDPEP